MKALICSALLFLISCGPPIKDERSYKLVLNDPGHTPGTSTVKGSVTWKKSGTGGITVLLCGYVSNDLTSPFIGFKCDPQYAKTVTDENGNYVFKDLKPNDYKADSKDFFSYTPVAQIDGTPTTYFFWKSYRLGLGSSDSIHPDSNKTYEVKPIEIYKNDVKLISPARNQKVADHRPAFMWEEDYSDAGRYSVTLNSLNPNSLYVQKGKEIKLDSSVQGARPVEDLVTGKYIWSVRVYGKSGTGHIAESSEGDGIFEVVSETPPVKKKSR